jgi:hypothetical protein
LGIRGLGFDEKSPFSYLIPHISYLTLCKITTYS